MKKFFNENNYIVEEIKDFDLAQTMLCGQCFHFIQRAEEEFLISSHKRVLHIKQEEDKLIFFNTTEEEYKEIWEKYFDLERDYGQIKKELLQKDNKLEAAINAMSGVRILNQDFFETMISFIISQNQQIPRIKQIIANISANYGKKQEGIDIFPGPEEILKAGVEGIRECKAGFRAPYIIDACEKYVAGELKEDELFSMSYEEALDKLKSVKGIGDKVANCILLFSLGKRNAFPIDVWMKRIMESLYFDGETPNSQIQAFAKEQYGELGGYAQQYLFYYGKVNNIGKK